jgi:hypothetical protein
MPGIFISRGMTVGIPAGGLAISIGDDGKAITNVTIHVRFDICPTWIQLSIKHLEEAQKRRISRETAWKETNEEEKAATLEREFESSMQAVMSVAIAIDSFYSIIQTEVNLPSSLLEKWRDKRTARYSQITEVMRRAFNLKPEGTKILRHNLKEIYRLRDLAVHPSGKIQAPILHPELNVGVEWRFATYRAHNAEIVVNAATWIIWNLAHDGKSKSKKVIEYMANMKQRLIELFPEGHPNTVAMTHS